MKGKEKMEKAHKKSWKRFISLLLSLILMFSTFPMNVYGKTDTSDSAQMLPVYICNADGKNALAKVYTLEEIEEVCEAETVFYSSIDSLNMSVLTAAKGIAVSDLLGKIAGDLELNVDDIDKVTMNMSDGDAAATIYDSSKTQDTGYYFPGLFAYDQITSETDVEEIKDEGKTEVVPMLALSSYQSRFTYLKTLSGKSDLDDIKSWMEAQMDHFATFRYCTGQSMEDLENKTQMTNRYSKWLYKMNITLKNPPVSNASKLANPTFAVTQSGDGNTIYARINNPNANSKLYYSINSGDNGNDFTGYIPQTLYADKLEFKRADLGNYKNSQIKLRAMVSAVYCVDSDVQQFIISNQSYVVEGEPEIKVGSYAELASAVAAASGDSQVVISLTQGFEWTGTLSIEGKNLKIVNGTDGELTIVNARSYTTSEGYATILGDGAISFGDKIQFAGKSGSSRGYYGLSVHQGANVTVNGDVSGSVSSTGTKIGDGLLAVGSAVTVNGNISGADQPMATATGASGGRGLCADNSTVIVNGDILGGTTSGLGEASSSKYVFGGSGAEIQNNSNVSVKGQIKGGNAAITPTLSAGGPGARITDSKLYAEGNITGGKGYLSKGSSPAEVHPYNAGCFISGSNSILEVKKDPLDSTKGGNVTGGDCISGQGGAGIRVDAVKGAEIQIEGNVTGGRSTDSYGGIGLTASGTITISSESAIQISGDVECGQDALLDGAGDKNFGIMITSGVNGTISIGGSVSGKAAGIVNTQNCTIEVEGDVIAHAGTGILTSAGAITTEGNVTGSVNGVKAIASTGDTSVQVGGNIAGTSSYGAIAAQTENFKATITYKGKAAGGVSATADNAVVKALLGEGYTAGTYVELKPPKTMSPYTTEITGGTATLTVTAEDKVDNKIPAGVPVSLSITDIPSGYTVESVAVSAVTATVELAKVSDSEYTFTMPEEAIKIMVKLKSSTPIDDNGGGTGGGGSGGGGGSSSDASLSKDSSGQQKAVATKSITAKTDASGKATASIASSELSGAFLSAQEAAKAADKKAGAQSGTTGIEVKVEVKGASDAKSVEAALPAAALKEIAKQENAVFTVKSTIAEITLDQDALSAIADKAGSQVTLHAAKVDSSSLPAAAKAEIGDAPVYDFKVIGSNGSIASFKNGNATVRIPYDLKPGQSASQVAVYYINDEGKLTKVDCIYDAATKTATFSTGHFSYYAIVNEAAAAEFSDVKKTAYYYDAVMYAVKEGLVNGTGTSTFGPDAGMTRAMFLTILGRASGINAADYGTSSFSDVAQGSWYSAYVQWGYENKLVSGMGDGTFEPGEQITRAQMAAILESYCEWKGIGKGNVSESKTDSEAAIETSGTIFGEPGGHSSEVLDYTDLTAIPDWARDGVNFCSEKGWFAGYPDGSFQPKKTATRAEAVTVLFKGSSDLF